ncbi:hypothetical protein [Flammeovirga aprica]|uniref:Tetratricopeptide repeat protein n=1 Tax=Flammeovirga aprica JL-4 TaxID=694437 RepID=A0A7X9RVX2_9BACT|nr:hypothetical protein [Flammeovirga aprica]NME69705.1 hypothetical protein [Flammeovirga aprica JL-4]
MKLLKLIYLLLAINLTANAKTFYVSDIIDQSSNKMLKEGDKSKINKWIVDELDKRRKDFSLELVYGEGRTPYVRKNNFYFTEWNVELPPETASKMGFDLIVNVIYQDENLTVEIHNIEDSYNPKVFSYTTSGKTIKDKITTAVTKMIEHFDEHENILPSDHFLDYTPVMHKKMYSLIQSDEFNINYSLDIITKIMKGIVINNYQHEKMSKNFTDKTDKLYDNPSNWLYHICYNKDTYFRRIDDEERNRRHINLYKMSIYWAYYNLYAKQYRAASSVLESALVSVSPELEKELYEDVFALSVITVELNRGKSSRDKEKALRIAKEVATPRKGIASLMGRINFYLSEIIDNSQDKDLVLNAKFARSKFKYNY